MDYIELPYPPSVNNYYRHFRGMAFISTAGRNFRKAVEVILTEKNTKPARGKLFVEIDIYPPDRRRRDIDNILKA